MIVKLFRKPLSKGSYLVQQRSGCALPGTWSVNTNRETLPVDAEQSVSCRKWSSTFRARVSSQQKWCLPLVLPVAVKHGVLERRERPLEFAAHGLLLQRRINLSKTL